jgi:hypothetical protein
MIIWRPFELHTHTIHSDADHTLAELVNSVKGNELEGFALTDHNTTSGWTECNSLEKTSDICILKGMECTTFHGHMILLGLNEYEDWRQFTLENINDKIENIHDKGGIIGIAHPFQIGSPISTGAHWEYEISDWNKINYMEVWHGPLPYKQEYNKRAYALWTELLNRGYKIAGSYGRDWHKSRASEQAFAVTCLGIDKDRACDIEKDALDAIANGRMIVTLGPIINLAIECEVTGEKFEIGEEAVIEDNVGEIKVLLELGFNNKNYEWKLEQQQLNISIMSNLAELAVVGCPMQNTKKEIYLPSRELRWLRAELFGQIENKVEMIAFTNPIYIKFLRR